MMSDKMRVWECTGCDVGKGNPCIIVDLKGITYNIPGKCIHNDKSEEFNPNWHETNRFEITERKPDYEKMAESGQLGKTDKNEWCCLREYYPELSEPFFVQFVNMAKHYSTKTFTPCSEPVELDPLTMEPVK
jgi:hypothetical protein